MKKLIFTLTAIVVFTIGRGQSFEGTLNFSMKMVMTDLAAKRDISEAKKAMDDPNLKPKFDKLREDLKDPGFAKRLDNNPALRGEVNRLLDVMNTALFEDNLSGTITVMLKGQRSNVTLMTPTLDKQGILYVSDKKVSYLIEYEKKQYAVSNPKLPDSTRTIRKTSEVETILGHVCTKYQVIDRPVDSWKPIITYVWTTTDIDGIDLSKSVGGLIGAGSPLTFDVGEGVPLRIQRMMTHGTLTIALVSIEKGNLMESVFEIPAGFIEIKR